MPRELLTMTGTYAQFEGTEIVAENCLGAKIKDLVIKGKTHISGVPADYAILDYIESTGTQYIDTSFKANTTTTKFVGAFTPTQKVTMALLGSRNTTTTTDSGACNVFVSNTGAFRLDWANGNSTTTFAYTVGTKYDMEITRGTVIINGTEKDYSNTSSIDQFGNFLIGNFSNGTTPYTSGFVGYIHECKLYSNDVLIRDFIPVKRISDNVVGMYDIVTETFFTNAGTGVFVAGTTVISNEIKSVAEDEDNTIFIKINDYIPTSINIPIPLRSLPNGTCDTIEENTLVQRVGKVILNGSENWVKSSSENGIIQITLSCNHKPQQNVFISNIFNSVGDHRKEGISFGNSLNLWINRNRLTSFDLNGAKQWLSENPVTVYYELATPIIHNITVPQLRTIRGTNVVTTNNNIKPVISCKLKLSKASITS